MSPKAVEWSYHMVSAYKSFHVSYCLYFFRPFGLIFNSCQFMIFSWCSGAHDLRTAWAVLSQCRYSKLHIQFCAISRSTVLGEREASALGAKTMSPSPWSQCQRKGKPRLPGSRSQVWGHCRNSRRLWVHRTYKTFSLVLTASPPHPQPFTKFCPVHQTWQFCLWLLHCPFGSPKKRTRKYHEPARPKSGRQR